jgi:hypothetical protein
MCGTTVAAVSSFNGLLRQKKFKKSVAVSYLGTSRRALRSIQRMIKCSVSREIASRRVEFDLKTERKKQLNHKKNELWKMIKTNKGYLSD